jgi:hypothetical protein
VHTAVIDMRYVARDSEQQLRKLLAAGRPVLLIGSSMVGKTRMAARVVQDMFADRPIFIPDRKTALTALDTADVLLRGTVVWLDDIDRLIGADGITAGGLRRLADAGNVLVATVRTRQYAEYLPTDELRPPEWDILAIFERIDLNRELSVTENQRLERTVTDPTIRDRIRRTGVGEYVGGAERIADQLRLWSVGQPDWARLGISRSGLETRGHQPTHPYRRAQHARRSPSKATPSGPIAPP